MDAGGTTTAVNSYGPDGLVGRIQSSILTQYQFDQQGNVSQRLNSSGQMLSTSTFDAYGVESSTPPQTDPFGYNAQWGYILDRETGLYACMFRYYDPAQGRWINRDPIGYSGGVNLYGYCGGGPVGWTDPVGHGPREWIFGILGGLWDLSPTGQTINGIQMSLAMREAVAEDNGLSTIDKALAFAYNMSQQAVEDYGGANGEEAAVRAWTPTVLLALLPCKTLRVRAIADSRVSRPAWVSPDSRAFGRSHTVLSRKQTKRGGYTQGHTFDGNGNYLGRTDVTDHGQPKTHPNPHFHEYDPMLKPPYGPPRIP